jgi:hypothetical protein
MAARPRKTAERAVKRPSKAGKAAAKALPESLVPNRRTDMDGLLLPYERIALHLGWESEQADGCGMDKVVALYVTFAAFCAGAHLPPELVFRDLHDMGMRGELKAYMKEHGKHCGGSDTPPNH